MSKIEPFHTNSDEYREEDRRVYHDQSECGYGKEIKRNGHDVAGTDDRDLCDRCEDLAE
jgi:hypothetical protein